MLGVKRDRGAVGDPYFEECTDDAVAAKLVQGRRQQGASVALTAGFESHGKVEQLGFIGGLTGNQESVEAILTLQD